MKRLNLVAAVLLAIPLIVFGGNYFAGFFEMPTGDGKEGDQLLQLMYQGGFMAWVAASHVVLGAMLLIPSTRFVAGALQLPLTIGIVGFHASMLPAGLPIALVLLLLNVAVIFNRRIFHLFHSRLPKQPTTQPTTKDH